MTEQPESIELAVGMSTHPGEAGRNNEDAHGYDTFFIPDKAGERVSLAVVADGIGGHRAGEQASKTAVNKVVDFFASNRSRNILRNLDKAFIAANREILDKAAANPDWEGMGTTMAAIVIMDNRLYVANVGDSRVYLIRGNRIRQLTVDHTWAQEAIEAGRLTPEEAMRHPNRNVINRYLGIKPEVKVDFRLRFGDDKDADQTDKNQALQLEAGDRILLCTDGLTDVVQDNALKAAVKKYTPQKAAEQLVKMARARSGPDNITTIVLEVPGGSRKKLPSLSTAGLVGFAGGGVVLVGALLWLAYKLLGSGGDGIPTETPMPSLSPSPTPLSSLLPSPTPLPTLTATPTPRPTETSTPVPPTSTFTPEITLQPTPTSVPAFTPTPTWTFTPTPTDTPTLTLMPTFTPTTLQPTEPPPTEPPPTQQPPPTRGP